MAVEEGEKDASWYNLLPPLPTWLLTITLGSQELSG